MGYRNRTRKPSGALWLLVVVVDAAAVTGGTADMLMFVSAVVLAVGGALWLGRTASGRPLRAPARPGPRIRRR